MATQREQILAYLQLHSMAFDDDQLAAALGMRRETVNMVCRALAREGIIVRSNDEQQRKLVNRVPAIGEIVSPVERSSMAEPMVIGTVAVVTLQSSDAVRMFAYPGEVSLWEDSVKAIIQHILERDGWKTSVQFGHLRGIDIDAIRENERLILEVKGEGSRSAMRVNYFLGALGELLQRMDSPDAHYGLALPAHRQFVGLIMRLPDWVCQRLELCFYLVRPVNDGFEVGFVPPHGSQASCCYEVALES